MTYFAVEDTDAACGRCQELGGAVSVPSSGPLGAALSVMALAAPSA